MTATIDLTGEGPGSELVAHLRLTPAAAADPYDSIDAGSPDAQFALGSGLPNLPAQLLDLFDAQAASRWLDVAARRLRAIGEGFYTIGSAGHEANAAVALALRPTDPALLHYRSGAFYLARAAANGSRAGIDDVALGLVAAVDEPIAGGRHKVFGHPAHAVLPQTSTIASHLPRAMGVAWTLGRQRGLSSSRRVPLAWPDDAVAVASFGDASANHSTALGAINAACWARRQGSPMPLLLVCEDNGIGISTPTPAGWIQSRFGSLPGLVYLTADGRDPLGSLAAARGAAARAREEGVPVFLHLRCVRIGGHAGSDVESSYRTPAEIAADLAADPLAATMAALIACGVPAALVTRRFEQRRDDVAAAVGEALGRRRLTTEAEVIAPLAPRHPATVAATAAGPGTAGERERVFGGRLPETEGPLTLAQSINRALLDGAARWPQLIVLGEDVARKGGVYGVTRGLQRRLGASRVIDTLLDEQSVLGLSLGAAGSGLLPVPEIQYLAYLHNAIDQLRGEAATLPFFSQGAYRNPMVVRVQGLAYQKGFGGHFHNDNAVAALRDIPGLVVGCPAHPADAPGMLRTALAAGVVDGTVTVMLEPIALYHERDVLPGDGGWTAAYPGPADWPSHDVAIGRAATWSEGADITIATYGNGLRMSLRVAARLAAEGIEVGVVDLRWLVPLPVADVVREAETTGRLLVVDETRRSGAVSEGLVTALLENGYRGRLARVTSTDSFVPIGAAAELVLLSEADVEAAVRSLLAS